MTNRTHKTGQHGETLAAEFLSRNGYTLLERNYRTRNAEIDIIARDHDCICFVEVKTRTSRKKGLPRESVHHTKQQKLISGASFYLKEKKLFDQQVRFDVIEIFIPRVTRDENFASPPEITLIKNAFGTV